MSLSGTDTTSPLPATLYFWVFFTHSPTGRLGYLRWKAAHCAHGGGQPVSGLSGHKSAPPDLQVLRASHAGLHAYRRGHHAMLRTRSTCMQCGCSTAAGSLRRAMQQPRL